MATDLNILKKIASDAGGAFPEEWFAGTLTDDYGEGQMVSIGPFPIDGSE